METTARAQHEWSFDYDDMEIRAELDGSVLFDIHNATVEQATLAASAPALLAALETLMECLHATSPARLPLGARAAYKLADAAIAQAHGDA